jgi:hypothetical protein
MDDLDYETLDPGIRKVVRWLRENGFHTTDSGDGVTKRDMACAFDMPNVAMTTESKYELFDEADRLWRMLKRRLPERMHVEIHIEASYDPMDESCVILLLRLHDGMLPLGLLS